MGYLRIYLQNLKKKAKLRKLKWKNTQRQIFQNNGSPPVGFTLSGVEFPVEVKF